MEQTIDRTRSIPEHLAKTGKIPSNRDEISKKIGELFISRFYINLNTDILDTPGDDDDVCDNVSYRRVLGIRHLR